MVVDNLDQQGENVEGDAAGWLQTVEAGHGQEERRTYLHRAVPETLVDQSSWKGLKSIGMTISEWVRHVKETIEARYYLGLWAST